MKSSPGRIASSGGAVRRKSDWMLWNCSAFRQGNFSMNIHPDFEELLRLFEEHQVDYMIVGGYAVAFHGYPRFTKDIDLFFNPSDENIDRLRKAP